MQPKAEKVKQIDEMLPHVTPNMREAIQSALQVANNPMKAVVLTRVLQNLSSTLELLDIETVENVASESSPLDMLVALSEKSIALEDQYDDCKDSLRKLRLQGIRIKQELLEKEGGAISSSEVGEILGITRQAVDKRRKQGKILAISLARRGYYYPVWQFSDNGILPGFNKVMKALEDFDPWMKMIFMLNPHIRLNNRTPLETLRQGELDKVLQAAEASLEQGAL